MCELCDPVAHYALSVGDLLLIEDMDRRLGNGYPARRFRLWRRHVEGVEAHNDKLEKEQIETDLRLEGAEEVAEKLRERLTKIDTAITADMDVALDCLTRIEKCYDSSDTEELRRILTRLRETYGPKLTKSHTEGKKPRRKR